MAEQGVVEDGEVMRLAQEIQKDNQTCADCTKDKPSWASLYASKRRGDAVDKGVVICLACAGVHRQLGVHVTFVKSLTMDKWTTEQLEPFRTQKPNKEKVVQEPRSANEIANAELEYHVQEKYVKPKSSTCRETREKFITAKYRDRAFVRKDGLHPKPPCFAPDESSSSSASNSGASTPRNSENLRVNAESSPSGKGGKRRRSSLMSPTEALQRIRARSKSRSPSNTKKREKQRQSAMQQYTGILIIHLKNAEGLKKADAFSDSDPYVVFDNGTQSVKSKVIQDNNSPTWNETLQICFDKQTCNENPVAVRVYDFDEVTKDDMLGESQIKVAAMKSEDQKRFWKGEEVSLNLKLKKGVVNLAVTYHELAASS